MNTRAADSGFWIAIVLGGLGVLAMFVSPVGGALNAALFFAVAWGIRRGQAWAAIMGLCLLWIPLILGLLRAGSSGLPRAQLAMALGSSALIAVLCGFFLLHSAIQLWGGGAGWGWRVTIAAITLGLAVFRSVEMPGGDRVLVETARVGLGVLPRPGDLVAFTYPADRSQVLIGRLAGTAPEGKYMVAADGRYSGVVSRADLVGRPLLIYESLDPRAPGVFGARWGRFLKRL